MDTRFSPIAKNIPHHSEIPWASKTGFIRLYRTQASKKMLNKVARNPAAGKEPAVRKEKKITRKCHAECAHINKGTGSEPVYICWAKRMWKL